MSPNRLNAYTIDVWRTARSHEPPQGCAQRAADAGADDAIALHGEHVALRLV
jgi:hypothetical protein